VKVQRHAAGGGILRSELHLPEKSIKAKTGEYDEGRDPAHESRWNVTRRISGREVPLTGGLDSRSNMSDARGERSANRVRNLEDG